MTKETNFYSNEIKLTSIGAGATTLFAKNKHISEELTILFIKNQLKSIHLSHVNSLLIHMITQHNFERHQHILLTYHQVGTLIFLQNKNMFL